MMLQPVGNRVLLRPLLEQLTTSGGIALPGTVRQKPLEGEVLAFPPDVPPEVSDGTDA